MIPKIIHYCWFGGKEIPAEYQKYINNWKQLMPDYTFKLWNELNSPLHLPYLISAQKAKRWANMSNFVRLHAIYEEGGIYLDTDVEVIKRFDPLLNNKCFLGFEEGSKKGDGLFVNNAVFGAIPKNEFIRECKNHLLTNYTGTESPHRSSPVLITQLLRKRGLVRNGAQKLEEIQIYTEEYFYPYHWKSKFTPECIKKNTFTVHHWSKSWNPKKSKSFFLKLKNYIKRKLPFNFQVYLNYGRTGLKLYRKKEILSGPFKGMKYALPKSIGSSLFPKLVGSYEDCLHIDIYDSINCGYKKIINIGCGEGYYAVGFARLLPNVKVYAYDLKKRAIQLVNLNAKHNEVSTRVFGSQILFDKIKLKQESFEERTLIFCDAEGYERELFDEESISYLRNVDLIIEIHDFLKPDTKMHLLELFNDSHQIKIVKQQMISNAVKNLFVNNSSLNKILRLIDEARPEIMEWAVIKSKVHLNKKINL